MELFLFDHAKWESSYNNCSNIDITIIAWEERRHVPESFLLIALGFIYYFYNAFEVNLNELIICLGTPIIYGIFIIGLFMKTSGFKSNGTIESRKLQRVAFIQVFVISIFNISAGSIFFALENFPSIVTPQLIFVAHFAWVHIHGIPPVIYIIFNKTIRQDIQMLYIKIFKSHSVVSVHGITVIKPMKNFTMQMASQRQTATIP